MAQQGSFKVQIGEWAKKADNRLLSVFHEASQGVAKESSTPRQEGGNLPYVKGNLQRSMAASTIGPPKMLWGVNAFHGTWSAVVDVIKSAKIGQTVWIGFQAIYAKKAEDKYGFVRLAAQRWTQIVEAAAKRAKGTYP